MITHLTPDEAIDKQLSNGNSPGVLVASEERKVQEYQPEGNKEGGEWLLNRSQKTKENLVSSYACIF